MSLTLHVLEDMHMNRRTDKLVYLGLLLIGAAAMLPGSHPDRVYQRVSHLLLTTASVEAAANGGALGEPLPTR